jgi:hypothetical protein
MAPVRYPHAKQAGGCTKDRAPRDRFLMMARGGRLRQRRAVK